jgi:hypothetical protein
MLEGIAGKSLREIFLGMLFEKAPPSPRKALPKRKNAFRFFRFFGSLP